MRMTARTPARLTLCAVLVFASGVASFGQSPASDLSRQIDAAVKAIVDKTGVPSASVGVVQNGQVVYTAAFGLARLQPRTPATPDLRYAIGSISKQFTVACVMLLVEEGKLSIDDPVAKYFPELTRSKEVTLRNLMSHTSGYSDYAPQDYTIPAWMKPTTPDTIVHEWATKPLDFDPGTQYQYSNTNFNIVGLVIEKVSGQPFWSFLATRVLAPLGMTETIDLDTDREKLQPLGYFRHALGPLRPAVLEAPGWYFADGSMAMPVGDLLKWDISMMNRTLLKPKSYDAMETETKLKNGRGAGYGLGVGVSIRDGRRVVSHGGEVGGYVSSNTVFPDDKVAVAVLTNQEASSAASAIGRAVSALVLPPAPPTLPAAEAALAEARMKIILIDLQRGRIDRSQFTENANFFFDQTALDDYRQSLGPLGAITSVRQTSTSRRGGMVYRGFEVTFARGTKVTLSTYTTNDGKLEQFLIEGGGSEPTRSSSN